MNGYYIQIETVMEAKLTKAQKQALRDIAKAERNGRSMYLHETYKPKLRLIELGLIEPSPDYKSRDYFKLSKAGKEFLAKLVADEEKPV